MPLIKNGTPRVLLYGAYLNIFVGRHKKKCNGKLSKEDISYYAYGIQHSPEYCRRFENHLKKVLTPPQKTSPRSLGQA